MACNQLSLKVNKTKFIIFHSNKNIVNYPNHSINDTGMERVVAVIFLDYK